jgi:CRISPR/Cas system-associated endoribonuclease Cas2
LLGSVFYVQAQSIPVARQKQQNQVHRIQQGVRSGELTRPEAHRLAREQKHINREKRLARADGQVTRREKVHIRQDQNRANRDIYHQKHDAQSRN